MGECRTLRGVWSQITLSFWKVSRQQSCLSRQRERPWFMSWLSGSLCRAVFNTLGCPQGVPKPQGSVGALPPALMGQECSRDGTQECLPGVGRDIWFTRALSIKVCLILWAVQEFFTQLWCGRHLLHSSAHTAPRAWSCVRSGVLWAPQTFQEDV